MCNDNWRIFNFNFIALSALSDRGFVGVVLVSAFWHSEEFFQIPCSDSSFLQNFCHAWNIDHRRWSERCFLKSGDHIKKKKNKKKISSFFQKILCRGATVLYSSLEICFKQLLFLCGSRTYLKIVAAVIIFLHKKWVRKVTFLLTRRDITH